MEPTRDELRLSEIQYKIGALGRRDNFNLHLRREALAGVELMLIKRLADQRTLIRARSRPGGE